MKRIGLFLMALCTIFFTQAQEILHLHHNGHVIFEKDISDLDSIKFQGVNSIFNYGNDYMSFPISEMDSITFSDDSLLEVNDIYITWNGNSVSIINPLASQGISITNDGAKVTLSSTSSLQDVVYHLSGSTTDGYLYITPSKRFTLSLEGVSITNSEGPAIDVLADKKTTVILANNSQNYLNDGSGSNKKAALQSKSELIFNGSGTLTLNGSIRNGIHSDDYVQINSGHIVVASAVADGIHCDYFIMNDGELSITSSGDGIDGDDGHVEINGGSITVTSATADTKSIKCDGPITINGGDVTILNSGAKSKGLKSKQSININGGTLNITASGATVLESTSAGNDPSFCTAIACDSNVNVYAGDITITLPASNDGGRGISADNTINILGGTINITTAGSGAAYTVSGTTKDSYTSACMKADVGINLLGGNITCSSSGAGGKGINSSGYLIIGQAEAADSLLILNVSTSGARITVSSGGGGGGGWQPGGPGDSGDYANPKGIKAMGALNINSGIITVNCTQNTEGGECIESKNILTVNGGNLTLTSNYDDAMNAANQININGGTIYAYSGNNDGIDSNGPMYINGGLTIARAVKTPEESFDCDNYTFGITGGIIVGTGPSGSMYSSPTANACTQHSIKYTGSSNSAVQIIRNSDNAVILTYQIPTISGGGGGGWPPGGGSSGVVLTFSSPELTQGTYTLKYGGTISGGTSFHDYYTNATYTGGNTKSFTIGTSYGVTTVQ